VSAGMLVRFVGVAMALGGGVACQNVQLPGENQGQAAQAGMSSAAPTDTQDDGELGVRLEAMERPRPEAAVRPRDPFRFGQGSAPGPDAGRNAGSTPSNGGTASAPAVSPPPPRIRVRMIGLIEGAGMVGRVAVLSDGDRVFHGRAGDVVEGRYRVIAVGPESVQLETVHDGQRQTIRLVVM
jgi:hypothetical protein